MNSILTTDTKISMLFCTIGFAGGTIFVKKAKFLQLFDDVRRSFEEMAFEQLDGRRKTGAILLVLFF